MLLLLSLNINADYMKCNSIRKLLKYDSFRVLYFMQFIRAIDDLILINILELNLRSLTADIYELIASSI